MGLHGHAVAAVAHGFRLVGFHMGDKKDLFVSKGNQVLRRLERAVKIVAYHRVYRKMLRKTVNEYKGYMPLLEFKKRTPVFLRGEGENNQSG